MKIQFFYFEDCPSHEPALQRLHTVMAEEGVEADVSITQVETQADAEQHAFVGSPTIRINGEDVSPVPADTPPMLSCRVYQWDDGRFSPMPSVKMIREALQKAQQQLK